MVQGGAAVDARGLVKRFGDLTAVGGVDLSAARGTCLGLLGPNGAGKTTTIEMLEGLKAPDEGEIRILDSRWDADGTAIRERIGVQLQSTELQEKLTVFETLRLFRSFYRRRRDLDEVLELVGMREKREARIETLSGGQKQRLTLGCALVNRPEILFLDEPSTGLDPQARRRVWEIVEEFKAAGGTVLLTTHYMEEAERLADHLVIIDAGQVIAEGSPPALIGDLAAESMVEVVPDDGSGWGAIDAERLGRLAGVREARREGSQWVLSVTDTHAAVDAVLGLARDGGLGIDGLHTHRPTLEDVFVALTGKHLRDG